MSSLNHVGKRNGVVEDGWPFVGRDEQLRLIVEAAAEAAAGGVVLIGPPGIGKTRLAREACARLSAQGRPVTWVTATRSAAAIPLGALTLSTMDLSRLADSTGRALAQAARTGAAAVGIAAVGYAAEVIEAVVGRPHPRAGHRPVIAVDDAHLLDDVSAALVHHLAVRHHAFAILVRTPGAAVPDALRLLWKDGLARRVELTALPPDDVDTLLRHVLGGPLDGVSRHRMHQLSAGNLLVLRELVGAARAADALRQVAGVWRLSAYRRVADRLCDAIIDQFDVSDPQLRAVVEVVACAEPVAQVVVERATDRDAVVEAERRGLITVEPSGARLQVRTSLPAHGEVIRVRLPALARRAIWRRLAEVHADLPQRRADDILVAAWWRVQAGIEVPLDDLIAAARLATAELDFPTAEELVSAARAAGADSHAGLALAEIRHLRGRHSEAVAALPDDLDDSDPRPVVIREAAAYWTAGVRSGQSGSEPDQDETVLAARTWPALLDGEVATTLDRAAALLETAHNPAAVVSAATATAAAAGLCGDLTLAERAYAAGLAAVSQRDHVPYGRDRLDAARCLATLLSGSVRAAAEQADAGYAAAVSAEMAPLAGLWAALRGIAAKAAGRIIPARQALHEAVALLGERDAPGFTQAVLAELAGAYAMAGDPGKAGTWLAAVQRCDRPAAPLFDAWIERNRAWVAVATRDPRHAAAHALRAAELADRTQQPTVQAAALFDAARLGAATEARDRLRRVVPSLTSGDQDLANGTAGPAVAFAEAATALAAKDPHALTQAAKTLCQLGFLLPAAELATTAYLLRPTAGRRAAGQLTLARVRELLRECPGADTPLLRLRQVRGMLTDRELQVARLAADGVTGRGIAGRLGLSLRTVNNHLSRAYAKLGISGRAGLAAVLANLEEIP